MSHTVFVERSSVFMPSSKFIIEMMGDFAEQYQVARLNGTDETIEDLAASYYQYRTTIEVMDKTVIQLLPQN